MKIKVVMYFTKMKHQMNRINIGKLHIGRSYLGKSCIIGNYCLPECMRITDKEWEMINGELYCAGLEINCYERCLNYEAIKGNNSDIAVRPYIRSPAKLDAEKEIPR